MSAAGRVFAKLIPVIAVCACAGSTPPTDQFGVSGSHSPSVGLIESEPEFTASATEPTSLDAEVAARLAAKRDERRAQEQALGQQQLAIQTAIDAICELPSLMPAEIADACPDMAIAMDEFMDRHYEGEALDRWNDAKASQMRMVQAACERLGSLEVAACQANAMRGAPHELRKELPAILSTCASKFGVNP